MAEWAASVANSGWLGRQGAEQLAAQFPPRHGENAADGL